MTEQQAYFERVKEVRKGKKISQQALADMVGLSKSAISMFETGSSALSTDNFIKICEALGVDPGETLSGHPVSIAEHVRGNTQLAPQNTIPDKEFVTGKEKRHENQLIPLYNLMAAAGLVTLFNSDQYILDYISIPNLPRCDGAVYVAGDSMYPLLKAGDIVIFRKVTNIQEGIRFGEMHVVEFLLDEDYTTTVKFVQKSDNGPEYIKLVSENRHHPPREVPINRVRAIAVVKASIRINAMV